jgi:hypothetical protein
VQHSDQSSLVDNRRNHERRDAIHTELQHNVVELMRVADDHGAPL